VFENRELRRIFGSKRDEVTGNGEHYIMRSSMICTAHQIFSGDKIEKNEMGGACNTYGEQRGVYRVLVGKREGKRPHGRTRRKWQDNIKMDLLEVGMDWIDQAPD
jgi:hypothetical protein